MGIFERYLTVWVGLGIVAGVGLGLWLPGVFQAVSGMEFAHVNLVVAVFIWVMIYPMMIQIDFASIRDVGRRPRGLVLTLVINWLVKPFTMAALAVLFFEHVLLYNLSEDIPEGDYICALDQAEVVRTGKDVTILTYSRMRYHCLKAVEQLEAEGVDVELIDLVSLKPFDMETIATSIRKTHKVLVVEECMKTGGIGAELLALITEHCFDDLDARPVRLSSQDIPTPYNGNLENLTIIQPHQIVEAARQLKSGQI